MTTTTLNPLDKAANATLSNGNLTITTTPAAYSAARSTTFKSGSGKPYFEFTVNSIGGTGAIAVGFADLSANINSIPGVDTHGLGWTLFQIAFIYNTVFVADGNIGSIVPGAVIGAALDLDHKKIWIRGPSGVWNDIVGDDPATNTGGINGSGFFPGLLNTLLSGNVYAMASTYNGSQGTINFGATSFTYTVPAGFTAWDTNTTIYTPGVGSVALTGYAPSREGLFAPGRGSITLTGYAPVSAGAYIPDPGHITLTGYPPFFYETSATFTPGTGHIVMGGFPPIVGPPPVFDWRVTVISQYANSPTILQMVENFANWVAPGRDLNAFYDLIWNIDTAEGYGLDVWGRIVGVGRVLQLPAIGDFFGFEESTTEVGFNQSQFYDGSSPVTTNYFLNDPAYRQLILAKALANISDGSIPAINQILINLFGEYGNAYVVDGLDMTMIYHFTFALTPVQLAIIENSGVLPRPSGVSATVYHP